jgi:hypothetical protein
MPGYRLGMPNPANPLTEPSARRRKRFGISIDPAELTFADVVYRRNPGEEITRVSFSFAASRWTGDVVNAAVPLGRADQRVVAVAVVRQRRPPPLREGQGQEIGPGYGQPVGHLVRQRRIGTLIGALVRLRRPSASSSPCRR